MDSHKVFLQESKRTKGFSKTIIEELALKYFISKGNTVQTAKKEAEKMTEYFFTNRPTDMITSIKLTKPRVIRKKH